ncbi:16S rRNA (cytosine(967)-C(5))-methyltransferase RsmB [Methylococcus capsulatus]|jgi:16S rRNA (cytosine967-C5)-methyltransferase|uniref:16S rRNA (cytosine(967)-C(5))-methyltransferase n=1 Tax=Methylococcus capsulatus TaxID=414 RepID=A0AA35XUY9_METCP|nr:16S rRNA (cytosine(967)-C(5))-methyltransferase RsmB [Methylococcus capsulatus]CAI8808159.1 16S rRNA m(5)C967 methyltransferase [Methylococcus capsulatus]
MTAKSRTLAAAALHDVVVDRHSLTWALGKRLPSLPDARDRAFVQSLCYGVLRAFETLDFLLGRLATKPIRDPEIRLLALIGLHQLRSMNVKPHAAVSETVEAAGRKSWAKPLLNAILRNYLRRKEELESRALQDPESRDAHPAWLRDRLAADWPEQWETLVQQNNLPPPMTLRVNPLMNDRAGYLARLTEAGIAARPCRHSPWGLTLGSPVPVDALPGFAEGRVSVQDEAAQLAAPLVGAEPGERVLDLCAAPGGKTLHMLELSRGDIEAVAVDSDAERCARIRENLERERLSAAVVTGDARSPESWWDGRPFDRILLDAPCSATGVIRRHPDIKLLRQAVDLDTLNELQAAILTAAWPLLKPGGILVYATCSVIRAENEAQMSRFLEAHDDAAELPPPAAWGIPLRHGRQILTGESGMDGFYYALLRKTG